MSPNSRWYHFLSGTVFRAQVIIDFRLARLASDCKLSPRALEKALFISRKAKHASLLWGMLVICRFPGLTMSFHHQTATNISSKKEKTSKASNTIAWLAPLLGIRRCRFMERGASWERCKTRSVCQILHSKWRKLIYSRDYNPFNHSSRPLHVAF